MAFDLDTFLALGERLDLDADSPRREHYALEECIDYLETSIRLRDVEEDQNNADRLQTAMLGYLVQLRDAASADLVNAAAHSLIAHRCESCGTEFVPANPSAKFCSPKCRVRAHRKKSGGG